MIPWHVGAWRHAATEKWGLSKSIHDHLYSVNSPLAAHKS